MPQQVTSVESKKIKGVNIAYRVFGSGKHIIFCIPGWTLSSLSYAPLARHMGKDTTMIVVDVPGWSGDSDHMKVKATVKNYATLFSHFIQSFKYEDYNLMGYSYGGAIIMYMIKASNKINPKKLILVSTLHNGKGIIEEPFFSNLMNFHKAMKRFWAPDFVIKGLVSSHIKRNFGKRPDLLKHKGDPLYEGIKDSLFGGSVKAMVESGFSILSIECLSHRLKKFKTFVGYSDRDFPFNKVQSEEIATHQKVTPLIFKGDHNHIIFNPKPLATQILRFLKSK